MAKTTKVTVKSAKSAKAKKTTKSTKNTESAKSTKPKTTVKTTKVTTKTVKKPAKQAKPTKKVEKAKKSDKKPFILFRPFVALGHYLRDSWRELRQVRWPNRKATWKMTLAMLVYCAIFLVFIVLLDLLFSFIFNNMFK